MWYVGNAVSGFSFLGQGAASATGVGFGLGPRDVNAFQGGVRFAISVEVPRPSARKTQAHRLAWVWDCARVALFHSLACGYFWPELKERVWLVERALEREEDLERDRMPT
jgi:hypothetical protein